LLGKIHDNYPGTLLSLSEYNYGGGADISGALAEADALGIFGRYGVFAACQWPLSRHEPFVAAAFAMYRNFDERGGAFGDTSIFAATDDAADTSVYASLDFDGPKRMVLTAINRTDHAVDALIAIAGAPDWSSAQIYQLTGSAPRPRIAGVLPVTDGSRLRYTMPPLSVSTIVLK
jgi:hypothetical protein